MFRLVLSKIMLKNLHIFPINTGSELCPDFIRT